MNLSFIIYDDMISYPDLYNDTSSAASVPPNASEILKAVDLGSRLLYASSDSDKFKEPIEDFLNLLSKKLDIKRVIKERTKGHLLDLPIDHTEQNVESMESIERPPSEVPSAPPSMADPPNEKEITGEIRKSREREDRAKTQTIVINQIAPVPHRIYPIYNPSPMIVHHNHITNISNVVDHEVGRKGPTPITRLRANGDQEDEERKSNNEDDFIARVIIGLMALGLGAVLAYDAARGSGEDVSNEELDEACRKAESFLNSIVTKGMEILGAEIVPANWQESSETFQKLDKTITLWKDYRQRIEVQSNTLSFYKKMVILPIAVIAAGYALMPRSEGSSTLTLAGKGLAILSGYGLIRYVYQRTYYSFAYTSKDESQKTDLSILIREL